MKQYKAFTLIELLVVIAIISLLVSILIPSLQKAKDLAKTTVCACNLKNIGVGMAIYTADSDGQYPQESWSDTWPGNPRWWVAIGPLVGDDGWLHGKTPTLGAGADTIAHCPNHTENIGYSIRGNQNLITRAPYVPAVKNSDIPTTSEILLITEFHHNDWIPVTVAVWYGGWLKAPFGTTGSTNTHGNVSNFLMCDGHVESVSYENMMNYDAWWFNP